MQRFLMTVLVLVGVLGVVWGAGAASVSYVGRVVDDGGVGVDYATVVVMRVGGGVGYGAGDSTVVGSAFTDDKGGVNLNIADSVAGDALVLEVSCFRYEKLIVHSATGVVGLPSTIVLAQSTINQDIEEVVVAGKKTSFTRQGDRYIFRISDELEIVKSSNVFDILKLTPLVQADDKGTISITGAGNTLVYINGRKNRMQSDALVSYLKSMPAALLSNIEVMPVANSTYAGEGVFGVVDIKLKKRPEDGVSGMASIRSSQAHANSQAASVSLDVRKKKVAVNVSAWGSHGGSSPVRDNVSVLFVGSGNQNITNTNAFASSVSSGAALKMDYDITDRQVLGFMVNADFSQGKGYSSALSRYGNSFLGEFRQDSVYQTDINDRNYNRTVSANINYQIKTDDRGSSFTVDVDYIDYSHIGRKSTIFDRVDRGVVSDTLLQRIPQLLSAWTARAEYKHMFGRWGTLSVGGDFQATTNDDDNYYADGLWDNENSALSNHFRYTEIIPALFVNYSVDWTPKFSTTIGGRAEYTYTNAEQLTIGQSDKTYRMKFLPSLFFSYQFNPDNNLSFSVSNRMSRPGYQFLNAFRTYSSPTSYSEGNPYLKPSNNISFSLDYMLKEQFSFGVSHGIDTDEIAWMFLPNGLNGTRRVFYNMNTNTESSIYAGLFGNYFDGVWQVNASASFSYIERSGEGGGDGASFSEYGTTWYFGLNNNVIISKKHALSAQLGYNAMGAFRTSRSDIAPNNSFSLSLNKRFGDWNLSLSAYDIFNQVANKGVYTNDGMVTNVHQKYDSRSVSLSVSYRFGNDLSKTVRGRNTSNSDIKSRL